jgi:glycosyltransferase involved in cell wall biosynthesis
VKRKKLLVIVYNLERAREHEWFATCMDHSQYEIHYALIRKPDSHLGKFLESHGVVVHRFKYVGKQSIPGLTFRLFRLIKSNGFDIVHTHLFESSLCGMIAAWLAGVSQRIVTRHHSDFHHVNSKIAVRCDQLINVLATKVVAISQNVKRILIEWEGCNPGKVNLIPHGISLDEFGAGNVSKERISQIKVKYSISDDKFVVGVVSRFIDWKGLQYIIPAFHKFLESYPDSLLILANAQGPYTSEVNEFLSSLPPDSYRKVQFEEDMGALYGSFSCFVHVPITPTAEAFGQTYIEAMASRVPMVITVSGVAHDFAVDHSNCLVVPYKDSESITERLITLKESMIDVSQLVENSYKVVSSKYGHLAKYKSLDELYSD